MKIALVLFLLAFVGGIGDGVRFRVIHGAFYDGPTRKWIAVPGRPDGWYVEMSDDDGPAHYLIYRHSRFYSPKFVIYHEAFDCTGMVHAVYLPSLRKSHL